MGILKYWLIAGVVLVHGGWNCYAADCPPKIAIKLCDQFLSADDTTYLRVRIVLDLSKVTAVPKGVKTPLRVWTEDLMAKYDLRDLENSDSVYRVEYNDGDFSPAIGSVLYHNVSIRKSNLTNAILEEYVLIAEEGCRRLVSHALCTEVNSKNDSEFILHLAIFQDSLYKDSVAFKSFLVNYQFRDFRDTSRILSVSEILKYPYVGFYSRALTIQNLSWTKEVRFLEPWAESKPTTIRLKMRHPKQQTFGHQKNAIFENHLVNGKAIYSPPSAH